MVVPIDGPAQIQADPPFLVIEILSPSTRSADRLVKRSHYLDGGLDWYWILDIEDGSLTVLRRQDDEFVEAQVLRGPGTTIGPIEVEIDPTTIADPPT